ncbi:putative ABC transport system ATP-binding protein [Paenibacillus turicensis]|uniref:ABC transport system ATP-binding protein n=1 Tax=Paenibacillus turicensis TaxID=160487 RepID=A0ABS4FSW8_9BACL|nr:putative ABC transport system ATP-binding protein [Paenibacillus turicensis]
MKKSLVHLENLGKQYDEYGFALKNITMQVEQGEMVAIIGESGSGKSTLLNIIGGALEQDKGTYLFQGKALNELSDAQISTVKNKEIGYIWQDFGLIENLSVFQNVKLPLLFNKDVPMEQIEQLVRKVLTKVQLNQYISKKVKRLSGGEKQRVAIARAIVNRPQLIIADEPTAALDSVTTIKIMELLKTINKTNKTSFVIATHNREVAAMCDRVIELKDGEIVKEITN